MFIWLAIIIIGFPAAAFALALASEMFAFSLSRAVEAAFERIEYGMALREREREARERDARAAAGRGRRGEAVAFGTTAARAA